MKTLLVMLSFAVALEASIAVGQTDSFRHTLTGTVNTPDGISFSGIALRFFKGEKPVGYTSTDLQGRFEISLPAGSYIAVAEPLDLYGSQVFIQITESGPNPDNVSLTMDPKKVCCIDPSGHPFPALVTAPAPHYPPAAAATGTSGEVIISVKIDAKGSVAAAVVESGHPLLKASAKVAAMQATFRPAEHPVEREAKLTYAFFLPQEVPNIRRYTNPYRIEIISKPFGVDVSHTAAR